MSNPCPKCRKPATYPIALRGHSYAGCEACLIATYVGPCPAPETISEPDRVPLFGTPDLVVIIQRAESDLARFTLATPIEGDL
ncbi:MAG: hypothetical protein ABSH20_31290 [Tepidisphaeraceae bacterium]